MDSFQFQDAVRQAFNERDLDQISQLKQDYLAGPQIIVDKTLIVELLNLYTIEDSESIRDELVNFIMTLTHRSDYEDSQSLFFPSDENYTTFINKLKSAKEYCYIAIYTITNDEIAAIIYDLFSKGVDVRILTDDETLVSKGSDINDLAKWGICIRLDNNLQDRLHHKFAVIDDTCLINGSFNWTFAAYKTNYENMVISYESKIIQDFKNEFLKLWVKFENFELPRGSEEIPYKFKKFIMESKKKW